MFLFVPLFHQVSRWPGSYGRAPRWWKRAGPPLSNSLRHSWCGTRLYLPAQRRSGKISPETNWTSEAGARTRKPTPHEQAHQHFLVPQPPCPQEGLTASYKPHLQTHPNGQKKTEVKWCVALLLKSGSRWESERSECCKLNQINISLWFPKTSHVFGVYVVSKSIVEL